MKCWKKSGIGLKIAVIAVFLLLASGQLWAWSSLITGAQEGERLSQLRNTISDLESLVTEKEEYNKQLQTELNELLGKQENLLGINSELESLVTKYEADLTKSKKEVEQYKTLIDRLKTESELLAKQLEDLVNLSISSTNSDEILQERITQLRDQNNLLNEQLTELEKEAAVLKADLEAAVEMTGLSTVDYQALVDEVIPLQEAYNKAVQERDEYYQDLVDAKADKGFSSMLGFGGVYDSGSYDAEIEVGIEYNRVMIKGGVQYPVSDITALIFDPTKFKYSAGVQYRF